MRIEITGESNSARALQAYLRSLEPSLAAGARLRIRIEDSTARNIALEGARGQLGEEALHQIAELTQTPIEWRKSMTGGQTELIVRANPVDHDAVERGLLRAILRITVPGKADPGRRGWRRFLRLQ